MNEQLRMIYLGVLANLGKIGPRSLQPRLDLESEGTDMDVSLMALLRHFAVRRPERSRQEAVLSPVRALG